MTPESLYLKNYKILVIVKHTYAEHESFFSEYIWI